MKLYSMAALAVLPITDASGLKDAPAMKEFEVQACKGLNSIEEGCYWSYLAQCTPSAPCSKAVLFFSGGDMKCDESFGDPDGYYSKIMQRYADNGYLVVCAGIFRSDIHQHSGKALPYHAESQRIDLLIKSIRASPEVKALWDGSRLLWSGVSHGATGPVIAMARTDLDDDPSWKGSQKTAACFFDGSYDPVFADAFLIGSSPAALCNGIRNAAICPRYYDAPDQTDCPVLDPFDPNVTADTLVGSGFSVSDFAIRHWKLIECGSLLAPCGTLIPLSLDGNLVPEKSINSLCLKIEASGNHTCFNDPMAEDGHVSCSGLPEGIDRCRLWFDGL